jgi:hypothetical protein
MKKVIILFVTFIIFSTVLLTACSNNKFPNGTYVISSDMSDEQTDIWFFSYWSGRTRSQKLIINGDKITAEYEYEIIHSSGGRTWNEWTSGPYTFKLKGNEIIIVDGIDERFISFEKKGDKSYIIDGCQFNKK